MDYLSVRVHLDIILAWLSPNKHLGFEAMDENEPLTPSLSPFGRGEGEAFPAFSGFMPLTTRVIEQGLCRDAPVCPACRLLCCQNR